MMQMQQEIVGFGRELEFRVEILEIRAEIQEIHSHCTRYRDSCRRVGSDPSDVPTSPRERPPAVGRELRSVTDRTTRTTTEKLVASRSSIFGAAACVRIPHTAVPLEMSILVNLRQLQFEKKTTVTGDKARILPRKYPKFAIIFNEQSNMLHINNILQECATYIVYFLQY
ncbi:hypothetical protein TIFTF001_016071 [Ficus carica]|uniref:Uncharacterized protein n=1 Tax=Ficus carica TaxID=3494 RepID=A0AA88ASY4_FICCA|nr:hypothetical protein TIFTF001_016071 [Ficus carica]